MAKLIPLFEDNRSSRFVLVPFCSLAQAFHAKGLVKYDWRAVVKPILQVLMDHDINVIQMPCMETIFHGGTATGLNRKPQGRKQYDVPDFQQQCAAQAEAVAQQVAGIFSSGYEVVAIMGMEYSPSCAVKVQYPPAKGGDNRGVFIREVERALNEHGHQVPMLGINRRGIRPTIKRLESLLSANSYE